MERSAWTRLWADVQEAETLYTLDLVWTREATRVGWITDEQAWLRMLRDRNLASHTCNEAMALDLYGRIRDNASALRDAHTFLAARYGPPTLL